MNILNLFKVSIRAVANNKMRSFLSMLGIIIGVAAVIIMMSIGQGSKESIRAELSTMGTNLINIRPGADMRGGVRQDPSSMQTLKMADYERIMREKKYVTNVSPEVTASGQAIYGNSNTNTTVYGESPEYLDIKQWTIEHGDCFTQEDIKKAAKVLRSAASFRRASGVTDRSRRTATLWRKSVRSYRNTRALRMMTTTSHLPPPHTRTDASSSATIEKISTPPQPETKSPSPLSRPRHPTQPCQSRYMKES